MSKNFYKTQLKKESFLGNVGTPEVYHLGVNGTTSFVNENGKITQHPLDIDALERASKNPNLPSSSKGGKKRRYSQKKRSSKRVYFS
jgi:hypothetical protein